MFLGGEIIGKDKRLMGSSFGSGARAYGRKRVRGLAHGGLSMMHRKYALYGFSKEMKVAVRLKSGFLTL